MKRFCLYTYATIIMKLYVILNHYLLYSSRFYFVKTFSFENTSHIFSIIDEREVICVNRKENFKLNTHYIFGVGISMNSFLCFIFRVYSFLHMKSFQPVASHSTFFHVFHVVFVLSLSYTPY